MKCNTKFTDEEKSINQFLVTGTYICNIFRTLLTKKHRTVKRNNTREKLTSRYTLHRAHPGGLFGCHDRPLYCRYSALKPINNKGCHCMHPTPTPMQAKLSEAHALPRTRRSCFVIFRFMARRHSLQSRSLCFAVWT